MWLVAGVFGILFMFCGYLLIYNVFEIAVTNDIRQYGLLRTVGTTSQQIKRLVNRQALYLFLIGTPLGLFLAHCLAAVFCLLHSRYLRLISAEETLRSAHSPIWDYRRCDSVLRTHGLYQHQKSVKKASRVSPIEAIRYVEQDMVSIKRKRQLPEQLSLAWRRPTFSAISAGQSLL